MSHSQIHVLKFEKVLHVIRLLTDVVIPFSKLRYYSVTLDTFAGE